MKIPLLFRWQPLLHYVLIVHLTWIGCASHTNDNSILTIPGIGRSAQLGQLYDVRTGNFLNASVFTSSESQPFTIPKSSILTTSIPSTQIRSDIVSTFAEKLKLFEFDSDTSVNILTGVSQAKGSASLLTDPIESMQPEGTTGIFVIEMRMRSESLQIYYDQLKNNFSSDLMNEDKMTTGTHLVTGIKWGLRLALSVHTNQNPSESSLSEKSKEENSNKLLNEFYLIKNLFSISSLKSREDHSEEEEELKEFSFNIYSDIPNVNISNTEKPLKSLSMKATRNILRNLLLAKEFTQGRTDIQMQLQYTLLPLEVLKDYLKINTTVTPFLSHLDLILHSSIISNFDAINQVNQELTSTASFLQQYEKCFPTKVFTKLNNLQDAFQNTSQQFKTFVKNTLLEVRSTKKGQESLHKIIKDFESNENGPLRIESMLESLNNRAREKVSIFTTLEKSLYNFHYFGRYGNLTERLSNVKDNKDQVVYVAFYKPKGELELREETWKECATTMAGTLNQPFHTFYVVDCDFPEEQRECSQINSTQIHQYFNGDLLSRDVLKDILQLNGRSKEEQRTLIALGRFAQIGALYDARTNTFLNESLILANCTSSEVIKKKAVEETYTEVMPSNTFQSKFSGFKIDPELQFSILADNIDLKRSGGYFKIEESTNLGLSKGSVVHRNYAEEEELQMSSKQMAACLVPASLYKTNATHFVQKVEYGFSFVFTLKPKSKARTLNFDESAFRQNVQKSEKDLEYVFRVLKKLISNFKYKSATTNDDSKPEALSSLLKELESNYLLHFHTDFQDEPVTLDLGNQNQVIQFFNGTFIEKQNLNSKKPVLSYDLIPIENLLGSTGILPPVSNYTSLVTKTSEALNLTKIFDQVITTTSEVTELISKLESNRDCILDTSFATVQNMSDSLKAKFTDFKSNLKIIVLNVKSGISSIDELQKLQNGFQDKIRIEREYKELSTVKNIENKLHFCTEWKELGANSSLNWHYFGRSDLQNEDSIKNLLAMKLKSIGSGKNPHVLFYKSEWLEESSGKDLWDSISFEQEKSNNTVVILDCDFPHSSCSSLTNFQVWNFANDNGTFVRDLEISTESYEDATEEIETTTEGLE